eukprot:scaffold11855_cov61-Phaeocystis_antarctica.AAC.1
MGPLSPRGEPCVLRRSGIIVTILTAMTAVQLWTAEPPLSTRARAFVAVDAEQAHPAAHPRTSRPATAGRLKYTPARGHPTPPSSPPPSHTHISPALP